MKTNTNKIPASSSTGPDFFEQLGNKAFLMALLLIMLVAFFVFKDFLLFKNMFQFKDIGSDTLNGMFPYYRHYAEYLQQYGLPKWSFAEGMGQGIMSGFLRDPFQLITMLAGPQSMPGIFIYVEVTKILLSGLIFFFFLKSLSVSNYSALLGTLLFSFCGFMIIGACWYLFTFEAFNVALFLFGFERLYQKNQWAWFALAVFLAAVSFPVNLFTFGLFILSYAAFRFFSSPPPGQHKFFHLLTRIILAGLVGLLLSGPFLLENIFQLIESPRGSGPDSYFAKLSSSPMFALSNKVEFGSTVMRMFSNDMLGTGNSFTGVQNYLESPFGYCGLISLLLMTQVFPLVDKKLRRFYIGLLVLWIIPSIFPYFRYAFWLFSGDYFRAYSFFVSLVFIIFSVQALELILKHRKINPVALILTLLFWFVLSALNYKATITYPGGQQAIQEIKTDDTVSFFTKTFLVFYAVLIYLLGASKNINLVKGILLFVVAFEMMYLSSITVNKRNIVSARELKEKVGYNDYSVEAIQYIKAQEKEFFRVDKTYFSGGAMHGSITDHKVHGYYGTSSYNSFAQMNFINFMRGYEVIDRKSEFASRWVDGLRNRPLLEPLNQVKYMLTKNSSMNPLWANTYDSVAKFGDVVVLKHKFRLPLGYSYNKIITESEFNLLSPTQRDLMNYRAIVVKDHDVSKLGKLKSLSSSDSLNLNLFNWGYLSSHTDSLKAVALQTTRFNDNQIEGRIKSDTERIVYFSFPFDEGWKVYIDGAETEKLMVNYGMTGVLIPAGEHQLHLEYHLRYFGKGWLLSAAGLLLAAGLILFNRKRNTQIPVNA